MGLAGSAVVMPQTGFWLYGAALDVRRGFFGPLGGRLTASAYWGRRNGSLGQVQADLTGLSLAAQGRWRFDWLRLESGLGMRIAFARLTGVPLDGNVRAPGTVSGAWGGPAASLDVSLLVGRWSLGVGAEVGFSPWSLKGTDTGGEVVAALEGAFLGLTFALGVDP